MTLVAYGLNRAATGTGKLSDLLNNNIQSNTIINSLTYKVIPNASGWLRVTK